MAAMILLYAVLLLMETGKENTNVISGDGYHNLIHLSDCQNISVYNMHLTNNHGDGLKIDNCSNIKFYNNEAYLLGHDALYATYRSNVEAYNNTITCRTNSGLRLYNTNHVEFPRQYYYIRRFWRCRNRNPEGRNACL